MVYAKRRTRAVAAPKIESEPPIHMTRRATGKQKQPEVVITTKRQPRKRKQSISEDGNDNTVALRKKKAVPPPAKTTTRKPRVKKIKGFLSVSTISEINLHLFRSANSRTIPFTYHRSIKTLFYSFFDTYVKITKCY